MYKALRIPAPGDQDGSHSDAPGEGEAVEIDHLLAKRNDKSDTQHGACNTTKNHECITEFRFSQNEQGGYREHHARRRAVHAACDRLVDVVFDDAGTLHDAAQDAKSKDGRKFRSFYGKPQNQSRVTDTDGDNSTEHVADKDGRDGEFGICAVSKCPSGGVR